MSNVRKRERRRNILNKKKSAIQSAGEIICVVVILVMTALTFINVCSRYIFHSSIAASEEITTNLFVVLSLVGAALALRSNNHIGLNIFSDKLSAKGKEFFHIFEGLSGMFLFGYLCWYGFLRVQQQYETEMVSAGLALPMRIYGSLCLIGFAVMFLSFLEILIKAIISLCRHSYLEGKTEDNL